MEFFTTFVHTICEVGSWVWPWGAGRIGGRWSRSLAWVLHLIVVAAVVAGLWWLNDRFKIHELIPQPVWARHHWLPIVFGLLYALFLTGWWIYRLVVSDGETTDFPDIDEAWDLALDALDQAGIGLADAPLFLILGKPEGPEDLLFTAGQMTLAVKQSPAGGKYPLHVYANRDGIYITCVGCSLMGKQASLLALEGIDDGGGGDAEAPIGEGAPEDGGATLKPGHSEQKMIKKLARLIGGGQMNGMTRRSLRRESNLPMPNLLNRPGECETLSARLAHLCKLIFRDRQPHCSLNGILVCVPLGATDSALDSQQTADLCHRDLTTIRRHLKIQCPVLSMLVDVEQLPGFGDFLHRHNADEKLRRIGQRFPLAPPNLDEEKLAEALQDSVNYLGDDALRNLVYKHFKLDAGKASVNHSLFLFLDEMHQRKEHLGRFVVQGIARGAPEPLLYRGTYLAGTGSDKHRDQGFVRGGLRLLSESQNAVMWTEQALADDSRAKTFAAGAYLVLAAMVVAIGAAVGYPYLFPKK